MKAINIIALPMVLGLGIVSIYYYNEAYDAYRDFLWSDFSYYSYSSGSDRADITQEGALVTLLFMLYLLMTCVMNLVKVKTMTSKVMSIIGLSISGLVLLVNVLMLGDPGGASYDETGPVFTLYSIVMLAFSIVFLVQSVKASGTGTQSAPVIDDID